MVARCGTNFIWDKYLTTFIGSWIASFKKEAKKPVYLLVDQQAHFAYLLFHKYPHHITAHTPKTHLQPHYGLGISLDGHRLASQRFTALKAQDNGKGW